jgi:hypothetical protein
VRALFEKLIDFNSLQKQQATAVWPQLTVVAPGMRVA